jgi:hypothetical protein
LPFHSSPASTAHPAVAPAARFAIRNLQEGALLKVAAGAASADDATINRGMGLLLPGIAHQRGIDEIC